MFLPIALSYSWLFFLCIHYILLFYTTLYKLLFFYFKTSFDFISNIFYYKLFNLTNVCKYKIKLWKIAVKFGRYLTLKTLIVIFKKLY